MRLDRDMEICSIAPGTFLMGSDDPEARPHERPRHEVRVEAFGLAATPVTQGQWQAVMGDNPSMYRLGEDYPVETVSWDAVQVFLHRLRQLTGRPYRLPTESEWEYAARAGSAAEICPDLDACAWHQGNSDQGPHPVGRKQANAFGLHDMIGNVWEWVAGPYAPYPHKDPGAGAMQAVYRGGSWDYGGEYLRYAYRFANMPWFADYNLGFRLALG